MPDDILEWLDPDTIYVTGDITEGDESNPLATGIIAKVFFEGAQQADITNGNGNVYPLNVLVEAVNNLDKRAKQGDVLMNSTHPARIRDPRTGSVIGLEEADVSGPRGIAGKLISAKIDSKTGKVSIDTELFDTVSGRDIKAIVKGGGKIGTSSRSRGLRKLGLHEGIFGKVRGQILQPGMVMDTFDFVTKPSVTSAKCTTAQLESGLMENETVDLTKLLEENPSLQDQLKSLFSEEIKKVITEAEDKIRTDILQQTNKELTSLQEELDNKNNTLSMLENAESLTHIEDVNEHDNSSIDESNARLLALEAENREIKSNLNKTKADEWIRSACTNHKLGNLIFENCSGRADDIEEAKALFDFTSSIVDSTIKLMTDVSVTGLPNPIIEAENSTDEPDTELTARSTLRKLAGID